MKFRYDGQIDNVIGFFCHYTDGFVQINTLLAYFNVQRQLAIKYFIIKKIEFM